MAGRTTRLMMGTSAAAGDGGVHAAGGSMSRLKVHLFGKFCVLRDERPLTALEHAKAQELLAYLLLNRRRPCRREALADVLWGETAGIQARKYFRQTLWRLHAALGEPNGTLDQPRTLVLDQEWVALNPAAQVWLDVDLIQTAAEQSKGIAGRDLTPAAANALREAVRAYRGDLLEAWPQEWCLYERERLRTLYLQLLDKLMAYCEARKAYDEAVDCGAEILRYDRARERTHRGLMRLHYLAGDRSEAVRQYARCSAALREELDVRPSARTNELYRQILADQVVPEAAAPLAPAGELDASLEALRALLLGFDTHLRAALDQLERLAGSRV